jgi:hypothetical protein
MNDNNIRSSHKFESITYKMKFEHLLIIYYKDYKNNSGLIFLHSVLNLLVDTFQFENNDDLMSNLLTDALGHQWRLS